MRLSSILVNSCQQLIENGTFGCFVKRLPLDKSLFLLDFLEIGKRKYTRQRKLCKPEDIIFSPYNKISDYRASIIHPSSFLEILNFSGVTVGVGISYSCILKQTVLRQLETLPQILDSQYPITVKISDGLDGSGCHKIYNQFDGIPKFNTKNFILFGFKVLSVHDSSSTNVWSNDLPNSPFCVRPVVLMSQKENEENVKFLMDSMINLEVDSITENGILLPKGLINVIFLRTMIDGKMSWIYFRHISK